jgi:hypothetical protein
MISEDLRSPVDSAHVEVKDGRMVGWATPRGKEKIVIDHPLQRPVLPDDGLAPWLLGRFGNLERNVTLEVYDLWKADVRLLRVHYAGRETLKIAGRPADCRVFHLTGIGPPGYSQKRWLLQGGQQVQSVLYKTVDDPEYWSVTATRGDGRNGPYQ